MLAARLAKSEARTFGTVTRTQLLLFQLAIIFAVITGWI
jgi:hypothetical protein